MTGFYSLARKAPSVGILVFPLKEKRLEVPVPLRPGKRLWPLGFSYCTALEKQQTLALGTRQAVLRQAVKASDGAEV